MIGLAKVTEREKVLTADPKELEVRGIFRERAAALDAQIKGLPGSWETGRAGLVEKAAALKASNAPAEAIAAAEKAVDAPVDFATPQVKVEMEEALNTPSSAAPTPRTPDDGPSPEWLREASKALAADKEAAERVAAHTAPVGRPPATEGEDELFEMTVPEGVMPGDMLLLPVKMQKARMPVWRFAGEAYVNGKLCAEAEFTAMIAEPREKADN
jgi:hypothetical protein